MAARTKYDIGAIDDPDLMLRVNLKPDHKVPREPPRPLNPRYQREAQKAIDDLLAAGFIEPSHSPFGAPVLIVSKKNGETRFCIDYRKLNAITTRMEWPLPRIDDLLKQLGQYAIFSTLDIRSAFWHIMVHPQDRHRLAFRTPFAHYQWVRMPFGFCNSPAYMQKAMNAIFGDIERVIVYMDDILVMSHTYPEHMEVLADVLRRLVRWGIKLSWPKCSFIVTEFDFLGFSVRSYGIGQNTKYVNKILEVQRPRDKKDIATFIGLVQWISKFIPMLALHKQALNQLRKKVTHWRWGPEQQKAFEKIAELVRNPRWLKHADPEKIFHLH